MGFLRFLLILAALAAAALFGAYVWLGGFRDVEVTRGTFGPAEIVYEPYRGPYGDLHKAWRGFEVRLAGAGIETCDALAVYLDSPETPKDDLRTILGCRIDSLPDAQRDDVRTKLPSFTIPRSDALLSAFPYKNPASYAFAPMKVYPEVTKVLDAEGIEAVVGIEIYGLMETAEEIGFAIPVDVERSDYQPLFDAFEISRIAAPYR